MGLSAVIVWFLLIATVMRLVLISRKGALQVFIIIMIIASQ